MKKSAWIFILLTTILGACSTSKSSSLTTTTTQLQPATDTPTQTVVNQSGKSIPTSEAKMMMAIPDRALTRKKSDKTMEQAFNAAAVRDTI